jgi:hypothetical protein
MATAPSPKRSKKRDESFEATVKALFSSQHSGVALTKAASVRERTVEQMGAYLRRLLRGAKPDAAARFKAHWTHLPGAYILTILLQHFTCDPHTFFFFSIFFCNISDSCDGDKRKREHVFILGRDSRQERRVNSGDQCIECFHVFSCLLRCFKTWARRAESTCPLRCCRCFRFSLRYLPSLMLRRPPSWNCCCCCCCYYYFCFAPVCYLFTPCLPYTLSIKLHRQTRLKAWTSHRGLHLPTFGAGPRALLI